MTKAITALERLEDAATLIEASQDAAERGAVLAGLLTHHAPELARLYRIASPGFEAQLIRMRSIRGMPAQIKQWMRPIKALAKEQQTAIDGRAHQAAPAEMAPLDALTEALGIEGLLAPPGYRVSPMGIWFDDARISNEPVIMTGVTSDLETESIRLDLAWRYRGQWRRRSVEPTIALDARRIMALVEWGFPVTSATTSEMVGYLSAFQSANGGLITERTTTRRMGWMRDGSFQLGAQCYGAAHSLLADGGLEDLGNAFRARGEWSTWRNAIRRHLRGRPMVMLALYASAAPPLLTVLEVDGFVMDWSGTTSRGKTSALRVAASVWGDPLTVMASWDTASSVGPQERAAFLHSLPLILDDTQLQKDRKEVVANMLYSIPGGQERVRGKADGGLRKTKQWRTIMLSSGEKSVIGFADDAAGVRARTLCIQGAPFGADTMGNRESVEALKDAIRRHYGHMGPRLIEYLTSDRCDRAKLRARWKALQAGYAATAGGSVSRRLSASVACLALTAELLHELGLPGKAGMKEALDLAWRSAQSSGVDSDRPTAAAQTLYNWCTANPHSFLGAPGAPSKGVPIQGWAGAWDLDSHGAWTRLEIYPERAVRVLQLAGFDVRYVIEDWMRRGFMERSGDKRPRFKLKSKLIAGRPRLYVFTRETLQGVIDY